MIHMKITYCWDKLSEQRKQHAPRLLYTWEEPQLKHRLHQTGLWAIFLTKNEREKQPTRGVTIPRLIDIGYIL